MSLGFPINRQLLHQLYILKKILAFCHKSLKTTNESCFIQIQAFIWYFNSDLNYKWYFTVL